MATPIYSWFAVFNDYLQVKFVETISTQSLVISNFTLYDVTVPASPVAVTTPFNPIDITRDYYSIARSLNLWFDTPLQSNKSYELRISGLTTIVGATVSADVIPFETGTIVVEPIVTPPTKDVSVTDVQDYSIKDISSIVVSISANDADVLTVECVSPSEDIAYYLAPTATEGRIDLKFNQSPAANYISSDYFKVQRKLVSRTLVRWEDVNALITADTENNYVYIYLPSVEVTPVYGTPDKIYWETGYKYRVRVLAGIGI